MPAICVAKGGINVRYHNKDHDGVVDYVVGSRGAVDGEVGG